MHERRTRAARTLHPTMIERRGERHHPPQIILAYARASLDLRAHSAIHARLPLLPLPLLCTARDCCEVSPRPSLRP
eukprot:706438-Pleurochrysis_carterae.AAC.2